MGRTPMMDRESVSLVLTEESREKLFRHLFSGDHDEHGAVIAASIAQSERGLRLLARDVFIARDGIDYVPGVRGYRMLQPQFIYEKLHYCREHALCYLAVHNHGGDRFVGFSDIDLQSHERGYPALLDIQAGLPVGALVFASQAAAGDIWFPGGRRKNVRDARIVGRNITRLYPTPPKSVGTFDPTHYDRQVKLFGAAGQQRLSQCKVGVIGLGGVGSLLVEYLALLGVGHIVGVDEKRISKSNRARIVGATEEDVSKTPATRKVDIAARVVRAANRQIVFEGYFDNFAKESIARKFADCDFLFLAADSMQARLVFNALVHQYLIPGIQTGSKVSIGKTDEELDVFSVVRWILPGHGCLWCNGLIPGNLLAMEAKTAEARAEQTYGTAQENPSVITLNAVTAGHAANDFLMAYMGLVKADATIDYQRFEHRRRRVVLDEPRVDAQCQECGGGLGSRRAMGDGVPLPTLTG